MSADKIFKRCSKFISFRKYGFTVGGGIVCLFVVLTSPVEAFTLKTHLVIANEAMKSIKGSDNDATINVPKLGDIHVDNAEIVLAVRSWPDYYRAGTFGPDVYPDLVAGQQYVHINKGKGEGFTACKSGKPPRDGVAFEKRKFCRWRSIDNGMYILAKANKLPKGTTGIKKVDKKLRQHRHQALAFAYGYLTHMIGDSFSHAYVNEWVRSSFNYFRGNKGALYGPPTEEVQHFAVESYIDAHMPPIADDDLKISTPSLFLTSLYTEQVHEKGGLTEPGAFGGVFFSRLLEIRDVLEKLSDKDQWVKGIWGAKVLGSALKVHSKLSQMALMKTDIGDPIADIEDYFKRRKAMIDQVIQSWVILSGCVAQNIVLGSNKGFGEILEKDDCKRLNVEHDPLIRDIFRGKLNEAVHYGEKEFEFDYGRITSNVKKQISFILKVLARGILFKPSEDIQSIRKLKRLVQDCDKRLLKWGTCDKACTAARRTCTKVVTNTQCFCLSEKRWRV